MAMDYIKMMGNILVQHNWPR